MVGTPRVNCHTKEEKVEGRAKTKAGQAVYNGGIGGQVVFLGKGKKMVVEGFLSLSPLQYSVLRQFTTFNMAVTS